MGSEISDEEAEPVPPRDVPGENVRAVKQDSSPAHLASRAPFSVVGAIRHHRLVFAFPLVLALVAAVVISFVRSPRYKAESRLLVGTLEARAQGLSGYVSATQQLASSYSRLANANEVLAPAAEQAGISVDAAASRVTVTPLPDSPFVRIIAEGPTSADAAKLASAAATSLKQYVQTLRSADQSSDDVATKYKAASVALNQALVDQTNVQNELNLLRSSGSSASNDLAVSAAESKLVELGEIIDEARLQMNAFNTAFADRVQRESQAQGLTVFSTPAGASSDTNSFRQKAVAAAIVGGLVAGLALASLAELRRRRRATET